MASIAGARAQRQTFRRFEWAEPGALLHMDVKRLARFDAPGHWAQGHTQQHRSRGAGWVYLHVVIDDHSRYLYVEQHGREDADTNAGTLTRAIAHFSELGLRAPQAVMTDNALVYTHSRRFRQLLAQIGARHITTPPYTPRWNGKAERVIRTPPRRVGLRALLGQLPAARQGPAIIRPLLQPQAATQQPRGPATHQPRSQPPWPRHLAP